MAQRVASGSQGRLNRRFLLVAILLAGLSAALVYARISASDSGSTGGTSTAGGGNVPVVVASIAIAERTLITEDMLEVKNVPAGAATLGAFDNVEDVLGTVTKFPVAVNQQVLSTSVVDTSRPVSDAYLAGVVPTGKRAFSISASQVLTAGGLLLPGDYVDVVWTCCTNGIEWQGTTPGQTFNTTATIFSRPIVQNVQIAAVAQQIVPSGPVGEGEEEGEGAPVAADLPGQNPDAATITLLVTPQEAGILLLAEQTGSMRAALRNPGQTDIIPDTESVQFITPDLIPLELMELIQRTFTTTE
jgi:pilus assembly protein CpaB